MDKEVKKFEGWKRITEIRQELVKEGGDKGLEIANIYSGCFLLGGRITEIVTLKPENITDLGEFLLVRDMSNLKRYKKLKTIEEIRKPSQYELFSQPLKMKFTEVIQPDGTTIYRRRYYETEILDVKRNPFQFPIKEPMAQELMDWVDYRRDARDYWLFPIDRLDDNGRQKHFPRQYFYELLVGIIPEIFPHWLRSQRASCMTSFYHWKDSEAMEWLGWDSLENFMKYSKMGAEILGSKFQNFDYGV